MKATTPNKWFEVAGTTSINFGPVQLYCFPDPRGDGFRFKVGSLTSDKRYSTIDGAKWAGLRYLETLGEAILEGVRALPEYETKVKPAETLEQLDAWHLSILGLGK